MASDIISASLDNVRRRKLTDLAYREGVSNAEALQRLIDRAYAVDLQAHLDTAEKPGTPTPPTG